MCSFYNSGLQVALALVEAIVVVKATRNLCALDLPNSTLSCFPLGSCSPKVFFISFKSGTRNGGGGRQRNLCVACIFSAISDLSKAAMAKDGHRNSIHNLHCYRATLGHPCPLYKIASYASTLLVPFFLSFFSFQPGAVVLLNFSLVQHRSCIYVPSVSILRFSSWFNSRCFSSDLSRRLPLKEPPCSPSASLKLSLLRQRNGSKLVYVANLCPGPMQS
jgi:hypothetical protein